jgi:hypothetical protein
MDGVYVSIQFTFRTRSLLFIWKVSRNYPMLMLIQKFVYLGLVSTAAISGITGIKFICILKETNRT